jgi:hypothetical protein
MALIDTKSVTENGQTTVMRLVKCDDMPMMAPWWASQESVLNMEQMFGGKHYCNNAIYKMRKAGTLPEASSFANKYA